MKKTILVTGAAGYVGQLLIDDLAAQKQQLGFETILATARNLKFRQRHQNCHYQLMDVTKPEQIEQVFAKQSISAVIHLASIVTPGPHTTREQQYLVDVVGTENILKACVAHGVQKFIVTTSGAAYGYHPENKDKFLTEDSPIRGNEEFPYSYHKRLIEQMLARYRANHPQMQYYIFRIGTVLGDQVDNQITNLFKQPVLWGLWGSDSPFSFVWDQDVVNCLVLALNDKAQAGAYNVCGDGQVDIKQRAKLQKKWLIKLPPLLVWSVLWLMKKLKLTGYGPEQMVFIQYRPVLDNHKLKTVFGYRPLKTSLQTFQYWLSSFSRKIRLSSQ